MPRLKYIGQPADRLLLNDGFVVNKPAEQDGESLETLIEQHPQLEQYYKPVKPAKGKKDSKQEESTTE